MTKESTEGTPEPFRQVERAYTVSRLNAALVGCIFAALIGGWMIGARNAKDPRYQFVSMMQAQELARLDVVTGQVTFCYWQETKDSTSAPAPLQKGADALDTSAMQAYVHHRGAFASTAKRYRCGLAEPEE